MAMESADEKHQTIIDIEAAEQDEPLLDKDDTEPKETEDTPSSQGLHPGFYIAIWIALSSGMILYNKWILTTAKFHYPVTLTCIHLAFATIMTQILAHFTKVLDSRKSIPLTAKKYATAIVPIGVFFSLSLICGNLAYLYLSVTFIQILKAATPVAVLLCTWAFGLAPPSLRTFGNVSVIVLGVIISSFGELHFNLIGFLFQLGGVVFEAIRLTMVQRILSSEEYKMDPLVSLYYFAPVCTIMLGVVAAVTEVPSITWADISNVGCFALVASMALSFLLNVSTVMLIGKTSSLVLTLSSIVKNILLVVASVLMFHDAVTGLQTGGFSVALGGLIYYQLGADKCKQYWNRLTGRGSKRVALREGPCLPT